jgi:cytochrome c biogenesis protein
MKSLIKLFSSVKLAIILLIIITLASIVGTLIPQQRSLEEYLARYDQWGDLFYRLQLTRLYQSSWFRTLLLLFSLNIITCTLTRISPKLRRFFRPTIASEPKKILAFKINERFRKPWKLERSREEIKKALSSFHYRLKEEKKENKILLLARKKTIGWFGSDVVHIGVLVILAGGVISGLGGSRHNLTLYEGQTLPVPGSNFQIRLDKFETEYYPNGNVKDWKSTLTVIKEEKTLLTKTIEVNHPLSYEGHVFYQSNYGWDWRNPTVEIWVKKRSDRSFLRKVEAKIGEKISIQDENIQFSVTHFIPDFVINENNQITSRSLYPNNPAARIEGWQEDKQIFSGWIFAQFPDFERIHSTKETDLRFELKDFRTSQFSVLQAAKDPGVTWIWVGSSFLMAGLALAFYWPSREIRMIVEETKGTTEIAAGGIASKSRDAFQIEFEKIMSSLRRMK